MWSVTEASPEHYREIAREIDASGNWKSFLTPQEHQVFEVALNHSADTWQEFIMGHIPCKLRIQGADDEKTVVTEMDSVSLAFRVRYMLWESQIDKLDFSELSDTPRSPENSKVVEEETRKPSKIDEDDYDDDYDSEIDDNSKSKDSSKHITDSLSVIIVDTKQEDSEPDPKGKDLAIENSSKMYDTFDLDVEKLKRFQRLKESDEQIQRENMHDNNGFSSQDFDENDMDIENSNGCDYQESSLQAFAKTVHFGSANLCLKHLLTRIESQRSEMQVTDIEIRNLISDVRKNRSKWASEERVGQEELYEACEKVVQELRGTTESSTAFLNKVSKREVPNYYEVIKEPMDLNTVMRKLRALQYNSKAEFLRDLNLIWSNCLTFNSDPEHFLRVHAIAMRKKTQALASLIPDVTIRSRAEVEAEAEMFERHAKEQKKRRGSESNSGLGSKRKLENSTTPATSKFNSTLGNQNPSVVSESNMDVDESFTDLHSNSEDGKATNEIKQEINDQKEISYNGEEDSVNGNEKESNESKEAVSVAQKEHISVTEIGEGEGGLSYALQREDFEVPDVETAMWNSATRRRRVQCITTRQGLFKDNKLQMDAPVRTRSQGCMIRCDKAILGEDTTNHIASLSLLSSDLGAEPFMVEYEVHSGLPPTPPSDNSAWINAPVPKLHELEPSRYLARGELNKLVCKNLNEMQIIRKLCSKINFIRDLQSGQLPSQLDGFSGGASSGSAGFGSNPFTNSTEYSPVADPEEDISSRLPGAAKFNAKASFSSMRRSISKIFMHAGFEAAQESAVDFMASVAGDYMTKLATVLVYNIEAPNSTASFTSLITGSLEEMGSSKLNQLTKYIADDILRQGKRLATFRSRLNSTLEEILRPDLESYRDEQFQENSDQFIFGQFSNELGDDYFGFKDLGIDKELNVPTIVVPFHLLQQRVSGQGPGISGSGRSRTHVLDVPICSPISSDSIDNLPLLVRGSLKRILLKPFGHSDTESKRVEFPPPSDSLVDAYVQNVYRQCDLSNGTHKNKHSKILAEVNSESEVTNNGKNDQIVAQDKYMAKLANQALNSRIKLPSSSKLSVRKKKFDHAPILQKVEQPKSPVPNDESGSDGLSGVVNNDNRSQESAGPNQDEGENLSNGDDIDTEINNEIDSLVFCDDHSENANGFAYDDALDTGTFVMQSNYDENENDKDIDEGDGLGFQL